LAATAAGRRRAGARRGAGTRPAAAAFHRHGRDVIASARRTQTVPRLALAIAALLAALTLAACGDDNVGGGDGSGPTPVAKTGAVEGELTISNWPGYLDVGARNTVAEFEQETGVEVDYVE